MVSSLDTKMHMQLQTAVCAHGLCARLSVRKVSVHNSMLPVQRNACRRRMKFIHACRLCLQPLSYSRLPCHCLRPIVLGRGKRRKRRERDDCISLNINIRSKV